MVRVKKTAVRLLFILAVLLLLSLSVWQLKRGWDKAAILHQVAAESQDYQLLAQIPTDFNRLEYRSVQIQGTWLKDEVFLLDNRIYHQQPGYEVLNVFRLMSGQLLLVNRGWVSKKPSLALRSVINNTPTGILYRPIKGYSIGESLETNTGWPKVSLYMDLPAFSQALGKPLLPLVLVLEANQPDSFTRIWQPVVVTPARHYAYALQWFGLAIVLLVFGFIWRKQGRF